MAGSSNELFGLKQRLRPQLPLAKRLLDGVANRPIFDLQEAAYVGGVVIDYFCMCLENIHDQFLSYAWIEARDGLETGVGCGAFRCCFCHQTSLNFY